jgi:hypothetical protein
MIKAIFRIYANVYSANVAYLESGLIIQSRVNLSIESASAGKDRYGTEFHATDATVASSAVNLKVQTQAVDEMKSTA